MGFWDRLWHWSDEHKLAVDAVLTGIWVLFVTVVNAGAAAAYPAASPAVAMLWSVAMTVPLAWRRVSPTASAAAVYTIVLAQLVLGPRVILPSDLVVLAALYSVTVHGPRWAYRVAIGGALVAAVVVPYAFVDDFYAPAAAVVAMLIATTSLTVWAFGLLRRSRRETLEALVDRARRLEVERDQQAVIATAAERARIAREMHDIVAHSLSVMIAQADGGRYAAQADPGAATRSLETIAETGRAALTDMRRLLGVLRAERPDEGRRPGVITAPRAEVGATTPQPGEAELEQLVDQVRGSGAQVSFVRMGTPRALPPGVGLTVYRIAQESLTNVLKHAGPDPKVTVLVQWRAESIELDVTDDGRGAAADTDGHGNGLRGMHERATMFGGAVTAGPRPGGGFRVHALIPTVTAPQESP